MSTISATRTASVRMMPQPVFDHSAARWNHNIHYHRVITAALPPRCPRVLDVGCGEGILAGELARRAGLVVGIDQDSASIGTARREVAAANADFVIGDFLAHPFRPDSFDAVAYQEARRTAEAAPPGVRYQRHVLWRYSLVWRKP
jgi:ubiquinone/menaquinone biosynthesis C-methylase UbiE